jgi:ATP-binding cassette subfamily B multidrug efflux pump
VLAVKDGQIVERGTHEELLAARGFYFELYMRQFRKDIDFTEASAVA